MNFKKKMLFIVPILVLIILIIMFFILKKPKNKLEKEEIKLDQTAPIIVLDDTYVVKTGYDKNLVDVIMSADDIDSTPKREILGSYDLNTPGEYKLTYRIEDNSGNTTSKDFVLKVKDNYIYSEKDIKFEDVIKNHKNDNTKIGIDVSKWQEKIDWKKVANCGVEFAIIRMGYQNGFDRRIKFRPIFFSKYGRVL